MTAREQVLAVYPDAEAVETAFRIWLVRGGLWKPLGIGRYRPVLGEAKTEDASWSDAAARIKTANQRGRCDADDEYKQGTAADQIALSAGLSRDERTVALLR